MPHDFWLGRSRNRCSLSVPAFRSDADLTGEVGSRAVMAAN